MATYVRKQHAEILRQALKKLEADTPIRAVAPGSIARALTEAVTNELGDYYDILDFNMSQTVLSTARGRSLDLIGQLYNMQRKTVSTLVATAAERGAFYFELNTASAQDIVIPVGTGVYSDVISYVGRQHKYQTTEVVTIPAGSTRRYASIRPTFADSTFAAAAGSLNVHTFKSPAGVSITCTNPKPIGGQPTHEPDQAFRVRISKAIRTLSGGTSQAIRFAALGISGVRDVQIIETPFGLGTFTVLVTPEEADLSPGVISQVETVLASIRPAGVRMFLREPSNLAVSVSTELVIAQVVVAEGDIIARRASNAIRLYMNTLLPGEKLVYNKMIQEVLNSSEFIEDVIVTKFAPRGRDAPRKNYAPEHDELIIPGQIISRVI